NHYQNRTGCGARKGIIRDKLVIFSQVGTERQIFSRESKVGEDAELKGSAECRRGIYPSSANLTLDIEREIWCAMFRFFGIASNNNGPIALPGSRISFQVVALGRLARHAFSNAGL